MIAHKIEFAIRDDVIPYAPRLVIGSPNLGEICETGLLYGEESKRVAIAMIAAAKKLYKLDDETILAIKPALSIMEQALQVLKRGGLIRVSNGSIPANDAFRT